MSRYPPMTSERVRMVGCLVALAIYAFAGAAAGGDAQVNGNAQLIATPAAPLIGTDWQLIQVGVTPAQRETQGRGHPAHIVLGSEGNRYEGSSGCNRIFGNYRLDGDALSLSPVASTKMACPGPLMQQERKLLAALDATTRYRRSGHVLQLFAGKKLLARFEAGRSRQGK